ncbi:MAG: carboxypeptidase-like regulatory domain-containing protein [Bacteroidales bacterium]
MKKVIFFIWITFYALAGTRAQVDTLLINIRFRDTDFTEFARLVESRYPLRFHYRQDWIRMIRITDTTRQHQLNTILDNAFEGRDVYHYADRFGNIIITKNNPVYALPGDFFNAASDIDSVGEIILQHTNGNKHSEQNGNHTDQVIYINGANGSNNGASGIRLSGLIREAETGEPIIGAVVYVEDTETGVITDMNGYYLLRLSKGTHFIRYHSLGKKDILHQVEIHATGSLDVDLEEKISRLKGVEIVAENTRNVTRLQMGLDKVDIKTIKELPAVLGETDILKVALLLPGVQTVGEGASGFNVRGGSTGQNLFLINTAPIFNSSHMFGFFSVFNPDVISSFSLYKSGIPARYGGRLSSVFDVATKTGNRKKFTVYGGISPVTGRLVVEGPIIKDKTAFIIGGRSTYSDWILNRVNVPAIRNSDARFHDLNMRVRHDFNTSNKIDIAGYYSYDHFRLNSDTSYQYSNLNGSITYEHHFSDKLLSSFSGIYSKYNYKISSRNNPELAFDMTNEILYGEMKADFSWYPNADHKIKFGLSSILYRLNPGTRMGMGDESLIRNLDMEDERGIESSIYFSDEFKINNRLLLYAGLRFSSFIYMGPKTVYSYKDDMPVEPDNISDTVYHDTGSPIETYMGPEFRFSLRYIIDRYSSVKISYNRMRQYLHMISNTTALSPTDYWKLSDPYLKPQIGDQISLGYYLDMFSDKIESSAELYYKKFNNIVEYKGGATLLLNDMIETDLINGTGKAYGIELMIKKKGRLNGWLSYTYSRIFYKVDGRFPSEQINSGEYYPANHDKPHDVTLTGNYKFSRRFGVSSNFTYSTGRPITYPVSKYIQRSNILLQYSERNQYRIPDYMRWDLSATLYGNLKSKKIAHSDWTLSVYNVTGRDNVYSIFFVTREGVTKGYKLSVFNQPIATLTYNFKF